MSGIISDIGNQIGNALGNLTPSNLFSMFFHIGQSKLGYLSLDVLVTENLDLPSEVTKYPVEDGDADITDHITAGNEELTISGAVAAGSAFGIEFGILCYSKLIDAVDQMRKMHKERKTFTVVTGLGKYEEMAFTKLSLDRSNSPQTGGQWLTINATLRKIRKVSLKQADLPPDQVDGSGSGSDNANGKVGGTDKKSTPLSYDPNSSALANGGDAVIKKGGPSIFGPLQGTKKMFAIGIADLNSQAVEATLDDILFYIILNWNQSGGYWTMGIRNSGYQTIVDRIFLAPNYPLLRQFKYSDLPPGELVVGSNKLRSGPIPRDGFISNEYQLIYFTEQDTRLLYAV